MARHIAPQQQGTTLPLRGPRNSTLHIQAPDGTRTTLPAPTGSIRLPLTQPGTWHYRWDDGTQGTITVTNTKPAPARWH